MRRTLPMRQVVIVAGAAAFGAGVAVCVARSRSAIGLRWRKFDFATSGMPRGPAGWVAAKTMAIGHRPFYAVVADVLDLRRDDDLLDVACGSGGLLQRQAAHVRHVAGLDASDIQLDMARRRLGNRIGAGTAQIVKGDAAALPWEDGRFSAVTCIYGMQFFPDPQRAVCEMYRVLRPGGRAVLTLGTSANDTTRSGEPDAWGRGLWSEGDARRMMEDAGFTDVSISYPTGAGTSSLLDALWRAEGVPDARLVRGVKQP